MEPQEYLSNLNDILVKKQALLREILDFTRLQKEALSKDDFDKLEILIAKKQARMDAADKLDRQFIKLVEGLKEKMGIKSLDELPFGRIPGTAELKGNTAGVLDLLREIKTVDDENIACMKKKTAVVKDRIKQSSSFRKVSAAYSQPGQGLANPYFDEKK
ncbi:MAG TPA: flagellar protein FlgN [Thermoclostridium sp.]|jgi:hypothetical protein|nr:flagellar protein FlgN [Clostridiaceae bacterium]HOQ74935.1 flagellar protein FlgN [Thermoclostridium sp.]HPU45496.1 flagellar protein FlgN [Thermoclostridium sp.]